MTLNKLIGLLLASVENRGCFVQGAVLWRRYCCQLTVIQYSDLQNVEVVLPPVASCEVLLSDMINDFP